MKKITLILILVFIQCSIVHSQWWTVGGKIIWPYGNVEITKPDADFIFKGDSASLEGVSTNLKLSKLYLSKIFLVDTSGIHTSYSSLSAAMSEAISGSNILINSPGIYNLGTSSLILKNGVNIYCCPGVTITSDNADGTLIDDNEVCVMSLKGFPFIENTNGPDKRIVLQNASTRVNDFWWEIIGLITQQNTNNPTLIEIRNTLGITLTFSREDPGTYLIISPIPGYFKVNKHQLLIAGSDLTIEYLDEYSYNLFTYAPNGTASDGKLYHSTFRLEVYP